MVRFLVYVFLLVFSIDLCFGVYTKKIEIKFLPEVFLGLVSSNLSVYKDGGVSLGYNLKDVFVGTELFVSSIEKVSNYTIFSTVNPNNLYLYYQDKVENVGFVANHSILSKVKLVNNSVYVLVGENGAIYLLDLVSNEPFVSFEDGYVWDIFEFNKKLYAITGNKPCVYEISKGKYKKIFESSNDKHLLTAFVDKNVVYIGSSGTGTIYVFDGKVVKPFISLKDGEITGIKKFMNYLIVSTYSTSFQVQQNVSQDSRGTQIMPISILKNTKGNVYKIDVSSKRVELLFSEVGITSLDVVGDKILSTTIDGKILEYHILGKKLRYSFYGKNFVNLANLGGRFYILGANPSSVSFLDFSDVNFSGYLETKEIEVGKVGKWGRIKYDAIVPKDTYVNVFIKGGNTPLEDSTWSDWVEVKEFINLDSYQYVKLKIVLLSKKKEVSPIVRSISIFYTPQNSPPVISSFNVSLQGEFLNFEWNASDPDNDELQFYLFARNYNETQYQMLSKDPLSGTRFSVSKYFLGNGIFNFMIVASDSLSNPLDSSLSTTNFLDNFTVDIVAPYLDRESVKVSSNVDKVQLEFRVFDNFALKEVKYSVDGLNWFYVLPLDGVIDSSSELFRLEIPESSRVILLKIVDEFGNINTERISF